jgi:hypothetical protein
LFRAGFAQVSRQDLTLASVHGLASPAELLTFVIQPDLVPLLGPKLAMRRIAERRHYSCAPEAFT